MVVLWFVTVALVGADQIPRVPSRPPQASRYYVHVVNGLKYLDMVVHCQSKDDDLGSHHLVNYGDDYQWNFKENIWGTTLFWCKLVKRDAYVSFESFWPESPKNTWLRDRCGIQGNCIWIAKNDGIYLRNNPANVDEYVHKWIYST
ncbi:S-protein homolog 74-like [Benincasa hispida]|uniref:S-protein homolog 74-like n=1 Tax=Benincasa hispida TaxID=102211 RepID=UPI0018FF13B7|nr:S-protein homolog 74-like [Benincasa hispida]